MRDDGGGLLVALAVCLDLVSHEGVEFIDIDDPVSTIIDLPFNTLDHAFGECTVACDKDYRGKSRCLLSWSI